MSFNAFTIKSAFILLILVFPQTHFAGSGKPFRVIAFYTAKNDQAHISFVHEANRWFSQSAAQNNFTYDTTDNWDNLNSVFLSSYQVVIFLDTRPEKEAQRIAFQKYMDNGGAWIGFHFAAFALTPSDFPQNWNWYYDTLLGTGQYAGNTWRPTTAVLKVEDHNNPAMRNLPDTFSSAPNEWYAWEKDLRLNPSIRILASIDTSSFPLGTGPKPHEIWHSGYYPVVWTHVRYRMMYFNMGHNNIDYEHGTNRELSFTFTSEWQNRMVLEALLWLLPPPIPSQNFHPRFY
jgi:hypothetical protein